MRSIKCVIVGDEVSKKSRLIILYAKNQKCEQKDTHYEQSIMFGGETINFSFFNTSGQQDYDRLRPLSYPKTDVFIVCFSIKSPTSFQNVKSKWVPEILQHCPGVPLILVGTHLHTRCDTSLIDKLQQKNIEPISYLGGSKLAKEIGATKYVECSSKFDSNVQTAFKEALRSTLVTDKIEKEISKLKKQFIPKISTQKQQLEKNQLSLKTANEKKKTQLKKKIEKLQTKIDKLEKTFQLKKQKFGTFFESQTNEDYEKMVGDLTNKVRSPREIEREKEEKKKQEMKPNFNQLQNQEMDN
ncbi:hypothetical protein M0812_24719 [Anaeramoeba flamelloides]|uniref:Uncharacterized protein n=1 Tax=Anaeramoeba flamelloides TaxID=1746091 RepID=A0AAV7YHZ0_9EUKA|nr:hypothetical protein M0812_24719 [Anaeramoeba flamelloides]